MNNHRTSQRTPFPQIAAANVTASAFAALARHDLAHAPKDHAAIPPAGFSGATPPANSGNPINNR